MSRGNGGKYGYYYCFNKACSRRSTALRSDELHVAFDAYLRRLLRVRKANLPTIRALVTDLLSKRGTKSVAEQQRAQQSAELSLRRHRIFEMREDGSYDQGTFRERLRDVDAEIAQLTPLPSDRSLGDLDTKAAPAAAQWFLDNVFVVWKKLDPTNRLRFERIAFPSGIRHAQAEGFRTTKPGLVFDLLRAGVSGKSSEVHLEGISSNQLYDYFEELVSFYHDMRDATPEQADLRSAA
jgi:hypothetical protein